MSFSDRKKQLKEQQRLVNEELGKIEAAEAEASATDKIGKCFRYRNSGGGSGKKWWLWSKVTGFGDGCIYAQEFQTIPTAYGDELQFFPQKAYYRQMIGGFEPVSAGEYRRALSAFKKRVAAIRA